MPEPQSFKNHGRIVPAYHVGVGASFLAYFVWAVSRVFEAPSIDSVMGLVLATALRFWGTRTLVFRTATRSSPGVPRPEGGSRPPWTG